MLNKSKTFVYIPNSSRLEELLTLNRKIVLEQIEKPGRLTQYDLKAVKIGDFWASIDSRVPNQVFIWAVRNQTLPFLKGYRIEKPEFSLQNSRIDFLLKNESDDYMLVETKSCTLVRDGVALFPDAPTLRGTRHLQELVKFKLKGHRAMVVWIVQREDAKELRPYSEIDPLFSKNLQQAKEKGVELRAIKLKVSPTSLEILSEIPVSVEHE